MNVEQMLRRLPAYRGPKCETIGDVIEAIKKQMIEQGLRAEQQDALREMASWMVEAEARYG